jgi:hypothetical protein
MERKRARPPGRSPALSLSLSPSATVASKATSLGPSRAKGERKRKEKPLVCLVVLCCGGGGRALNFFSRAHGKLIDWRWVWTFLSTFLCYLLVKCFSRAIHLLMFNAKRFWNILSVLAREKVHPKKCFHERTLVICDRKRQIKTSVLFPGFPVPEFPGSRQFFHYCCPGKLARDSRNRIYKGKMYILLVFPVFSIKCYEFAEKSTIMSIHLL